MQGESLQQAAVTATGVLGDRAYGVLDLQRDCVVSAKQVVPFAGLMRCRARFATPPQQGRPLPPVSIELPDGRILHSDQGDVDAGLSAFLGTPVVLVPAVDGVLTYKRYPPQASRSAVQEGGAPAPTGALRDAFPVSLLTTATLSRLQANRPGSRFDVRRFRMNVIVETTARGFVENDWPGHTAALGARCRLAVRLPDPRCIMTTLPQDNLVHDAAILKAIAQHNRLRVEGLGLRPCAGVYAEVLAPGTVRVGDSVTVQD